MFPLAFDGYSSEVMVVVTTAKWDRLKFVYSNEIDFRKIISNPFSDNFIGSTYES